MIAIYQRTASGVVRTDTATTVAEAYDKLRGIDAPAIAFDGLLAVGATWRTTERERAAITKHVDGVGRGRSTAGDSCRLCTDPCARVTFKTPAALAGFCSTHRDRIRACRGVDPRDPCSVDAYVARAEARDAR